MEPGEVRGLSPLLGCSFPCEDSEFTRQALSLAPGVWVGFLTPDSPKILRPFAPSASFLLPRSPCVEVAGLGLVIDGADGLLGFAQSSWQSLDLCAARPGPAPGDLNQGAMPPGRRACSLMFVADN